MFGVIALHVAIQSASAQIRSIFERAFESSLLIAPAKSKSERMFCSPPPTNDTESISKTNSRHRIRKQSKRTATAVAPTVNYSPQRLLSDQNIKSISAGRRNV